MKAPNDDGAPAVCDRSSNGLQHMAGFSHVAYCTGPFQLASLLASLEVCGIPQSRCRVLPFQGAARNDDLKKTLVETCSRLGMETVDPALMPSPTLSDARRQYDPANTRPRVVHWYCQGTPYASAALRHLRIVLPNIVFEYYDGLGSYIAASEQERKCISLSDARGIGDLRQLAVQRLMHPDMHLMPEDGLWQKYAPPDSQARTRYIPSSITLRNVRLVGEILDDISGDPWPLGKSPDIVLLPTRFAETIGRGDIKDIEKEVGMYDDLLRVIRSVSRTASILVKTHPRAGAGAGTETVQRLQDICVNHDARLYEVQQLVEYMLDRSRRRDVVVIGYRSTSLLNTVLFGWGRSLCLSRRFIASYVGNHERYHSSLTAIDLLSMSGVTIIDSLAELSEFLQAQMPR